VTLAKRGLAAQLKAQISWSLTLPQHRGHACRHVPCGHVRVPARPALCVCVCVVSVKPASCCAGRNQNPALIAHLRTVCARQGFDQVVHLQGRPHRSDGPAVQRAVGTCQRYSRQQGVRVRTQNPHTSTHARTQTGVCVRVWQQTDTMTQW
jgi:hypothetical protein